MRNIKIELGDLVFAEHLTTDNSRVLRHPFLILAYSQNNIYGIFVQILRFNNDNTIRNEFANDFWIELENPNLRRPSAVVLKEFTLINESQVLSKLQECRTEEDLYTEIIREIVANRWPENKLLNDPEIIDLLEKSCENYDLLNFQLR